MKSEVMWISILCSVLIVGCVSTTSGCDTPDDDDDMAPGEGYEIGAMVTLRGDRLWEFGDRLLWPIEG